MTRCVMALLLLATGCGGAGVPGGDQPAENPRTVLQVRDATTGSLAWEVERDAEEGGTEPLLADDRVFLAAPIGDLTVYDARSGRVVWEADGTQLPEALTDGVAVLDLQDRVEGRAIADGRLLWQSATAANVVRAREGGALVLVEDGQTAGGSSAVSRLEPRTGRTSWKVTFPGGADTSRAGVATSVVLVNVRTESTSSRVRALSLQDGTQLWEVTADYIDNVATDGDLPAVALGLENREAQVLDPRSGDVLWKAPASDYHHLLQQPFLGDTEREGFRRDRRTGERLPGSVPFTYGLGAFGDLLVGADSTTLTAAKGASVAWTADLPSGKRPGTLLDVDGRWVASVTQVGQAERAD